VGGSARITGSLGGPGPLKEMTAPNSPNFEGPRYPKGRPKKCLGSLSIAIFSGPHYLVCNSSTGGSYFAIDVGAPKGVEQNFLNVCGLLEQNYLTYSHVKYDDHFCSRLSAFPAKGRKCARVRIRVNLHETSLLFWKQWKGTDAADYRPTERADGVLDGQAELGEDAKSFKVQARCYIRVSYGKSLKYTKENDFRFGRIQSQ
jgi:hypothetical protein